MTVQRAVWISLCLLVLAVLWWLDRSQPQAGAWALVGLSVSVGVLHGALDAPLLQRKFTQRAVLLVVLAAYLAAVLLLGWWLSSAVAVALWLLIAMSIWHFGEPYGRWDNLPSWSALLTRAVVGGASIMLPVWLAPDELASLMALVVEPVGLQVWRLMAMAWLVLLAIWLLAIGLPQMRAAQQAWFELIGCTAAYLLFSPVMAFALYFGAYHAPVHIWRVWQAWRASQPAPVAKPRGELVAAGLAATLLATWLLGAGLWLLLSDGFAAVPDSSGVLRWLIVALAAVTAPHLVLISACSDFLSRKRTEI